MENSRLPADALAELKSIADAMNAISSFLSHEQIRDSADLRQLLQPDANSDDRQIDVIAFCASAVLFTADVVFSVVKEIKDLRDGLGSNFPTSDSHRIILVLCGGFGHSTHYMHEAVARHPRYGPLASRLAGQPEARILQAIGEEFFSLVAQNDDKNDNPGTSGEGFANKVVEVLVEDKSTNCGANAACSKALLERHGIFNPRSIVVAQDPTMCRRTVASFEKAYGSGENDRPRVYSWPTFVPQVRPGTLSSGIRRNPLSFTRFKTLEYGGPTIDDLWDMARFTDLIMGEVPRLRDDQSGYGPNGKGYIAHVDIPQAVNDAWGMLRSILGNTDRTG